MAADFGRLDALVNNAAILRHVERALDADLAQVRAALETNTFGAWSMVQGGGLARRDGRRRAGVQPVEGGAERLTRMLAAELREEGILVNAACPGWVATDRGGSGGRPVAEGAASVVWAATLPDDGPTGGCFRDGQPVPW